jgi:hypothetical protein
MDLPAGDQIFLLDTRNHLAYLATIRWRKSKSAGVEFIRTYDLNSALPPELSFLEKLLIEAKLRQILTLERRGTPLEHAASIVGLTERHLGRVDEHRGLAVEFGSLINELMAFVETGVLSSKRKSKREGSEHKFFQRHARR